MTANYERATTVRSNFEEDKFSTTQTETDIPAVEIDPSITRGQLAEDIGSAVLDRANEINELTEE